jgi:plastocyanin
VRRVLALLAVLTAAFGFAACSTNASNKPRPAQAPIDFRGRKQVDVDAQYNLFTPADIIVSPGTTVTWHNRDSYAHNITKSTDLVDFHGNFGVDAQHFGPGATYSFTFTTPGVNYFYACTIHTGMSGRVEVVAEPGGPTTTVKP